MKRMMLKSEEVSLNTLRVASNEWPGFVYYQGVTSRTALSTSEKATQTIKNTKNKALSKNCVRPQSRRFTQKNDNTQENCKREINLAETSHIDCDSNKDTKRTKCFASGINKSQTSQCTRPASSARNESPTSDEVICQKRSSHTDKTVYPLPNVSWNEMPRVVDERLRLTSYSSNNNPWLSNKMPRPQTAGPRVIVPLKHTCPVGLNKEDIIRGTRLGDQNTTQGDIDSNKLLNGTSTSSTTSKQSSEKRITIKEESHRKFCRFIKRKENDKHIAALELTITSIHPETPNNSAVLENSSCDNGNNNENLICNSNDNDSNTSLFINSYNYNTLEGIRKSYRRAQSAPPTHHRNDRVQCGNTFSLENQANQKQFSNLYWRAKSAYHKRLEAMSEEESDCNGKEDQKTYCLTSSTKHTLLRPLLRVDGDIKHSAGCPYKCKGCFKACLVSDDYVQKAIAKAVQESENHVETIHEKRRPSRVVAKSDIVREALGRSQPLFHHVYGGGRVRGRIKIRPWPKYGWMDLKMKKIDNGYEEIKTDDDDDDDNDDDDDGHRVERNSTNNYKQ